jgi:hypothetical protein
MEAFKALTITLSRTLAAVGLISFALTSFAATTTQIATISSATTDGSASSSTFQLSVTSGQLANALTTSSDIELSLALAPQASHRGLKASVYNADNGKDHWSVGSYMIMEKNARFGSRTIGATDEGHNALKIDPVTLKPSGFGNTIYTSNVHEALQDYLGLSNDVFKFNNDARFDFFN